MKKLSLTQPTNRASLAGHYNVSVRTIDREMKRAGIEIARYQHQITPAQLKKFVAWYEGIDTTHIKEVTN